MPKDSPDNALLRADELGKQVTSPDGALTILENVSLAIGRGESVAIVGPSGSGKSTLLGLLAGLDVPSKGSVWLDGENLSALDEDARAARRARQVGFVFQSFHLLPGLTALENVMLPLELSGQSQPEQKARAVLAAVGLADRANYYPPKLSGGEQQRVAIARAYAGEPAILFADEPTGNLDAVTGQLIIDLLFRLNREHHATLVLVTHDTELAGRCDRILNLHAGRFGGCMMLLQLSLRQFRRGLRSGELIVMALALVLALAAVSAVGFFTGRVHTAIQEQAGESLAADLVFSSGEPLSSRFAQIARTAGANTAQVMDFPTVLFNGDHTVLTDIHAVSETYPLRGQVRVSAQAFGPARVTHAIPASGTVWVESRVLTTLGLKVGDTVQIGKLKAHIASVIAYLPDGGFGFSSLAPKVLLNIADIPATGLVNTNSRVSYKLLMAGRPDLISGLEKNFQKNLPAGVEMQDASDSRRELVDATDSAQRFLALAALVSVLISAVAIILAARRYATRYTDAAAVLKCLGLTRRRVQTLLLLELLWLGILAGIIGVIIGFLSQFGLVAALKGLLPAELPTPSLIPALSAFGIGLVLLIGFALPPLMRLGDTPPARVLRRDLVPPPVRAYVVYGAAILTTLLLTWWQVRELRLALYVLLGLAITVAVLTLGAAFILVLLRPLRRGVGAGWRYGLANLNRHRRDAVIQMVAFGIGLMVLLLLGLVRGDLLSSWRTTLPADAPNQFIINIQPDQRSTVQNFFAAHGLPAPMLYPIVRARLTAINGVDVGKIHFPDPRAQHMLNREANLSWSETLPSANTITAGHWWDKNEAIKPLASIEEDFAQQLHLKVGDTLTFDITGTPATVAVASLRKIRWDSFQPNFFVELSPGALSGYPATWITSLYLPPQKAVILADLVRQLPSLTIFDVDAILEQVRHLMDQASLAVEYVFLFTLGAGIVVLLAAVQATRDERRFEAAVMRALGASRRLLRSAAAAEYAALGFVAGLLGALTATLVAWLLASRVFSLPYHPDWRVWAIGVIAGTLIVGLSGLLANRRILNAPPVETLRET